MKKEGGQNAFAFCHTLFLYFAVFFVFSAAVFMK